MGRKIPGKKHRKVKDPKKQETERYKKLKGKINAPPLHPDEQEVPKTALRIAELKERVKNGKVKVKRRVNDPLLARKVGECRENHLERISKVCDTLIQESNYSAKYGVKFQRSESTGEVKVVKAPPNKQLLLERKLYKEQKRKETKKKKKVDVQQPKLSKSQKKKHKLLLKMENKRLHSDSNFNENRKDYVKFGEVVHAPPTLSLPKKVAKTTDTPRPGTKNLLLKSLIDNKPNKSALVSKSTKPGIDKTGKRKNLPNALRRQLENNQSEMIKAYRELKKNKIKSNT